MKPLDKLKKARAQLILESPFFGNLSLRLKLVEAPNIKTMAVDPETLFYNPDFVDGLPMAELKGVTCHEVLHVSLGHSWRRGGRDGEKWNVACDYAINPLALEAGHTLPEGALANQQYSGMAAEEIYKLLPPGSGGGGGDGGTLPDGRKVSADPSGCGSVADPAPDANGNELTPEKVRELEKKWKQASAQATQMARAAGKLGGDMELAIQSELIAKAPWELLLREFLVQTAKSDYCWSSPARRHVHNGMHLPSLRSDETPPIAFVVDTSGSISKADLEQISSELNSILEEIQPKVLHLICADTAVNAHVELSTDDYPVELVVKGRGGTLLQPALSFAAELEEPPAALIYMTDLKSRDIKTIEDPGFPVLWIDTRPQQTKAMPSFGEVVEL